MAVTLRLTGMSGAIGTLKGVGPDLERKTILRLSQVAFDEAQRGAGRHNKTGALFQSLYNRQTTNGRAVGHDTQRAPHAEFVLLGARPHKIVPKNKKALRWAKGGRFFFAKAVQHPGYRGDAYLILAATQAVREFSQIVDQSFREVP